MLENTCKEHLGIYARDDFFLNYLAHPVSKTLPFLNRINVCNYVTNMLQGLDMTQDWFNMRCLAGKEWILSFVGISLQGHNK